MKVKPLKPILLAASLIISSWAFAESTAEDYFARGIAKQDDGDIEAAITKYNKALALNPKNASAYNNRGLAKLTKGDVNGALEDCNRAIGLNPKASAAYNNRGNAQTTEG